MVLIVVIFKLNQLLFEHLVLAVLTEFWNVGTGDKKGMVQGEGNVQVGDEELLVRNNLSRVMV